jgi:hypothetical protein
MDQYHGKYIPCIEIFQAYADVWLLCDNDKVDDRGI